MYSWIDLNTYQYQNKYVVRLIFFPVFEEVIENMAHKAQLHFLPQYLSTEGPF